MGGLFLLLSKNWKLRNLQPLIDSIERIADRWSHDHHTGKDQTSAEEADHKAGNQYRSNRFAPIESIDGFDCCNIQKDRVETQRNAEETHTNAQNGDAAE